MFTIISATNRPSSKSLAIAKYYAGILAEAGVDHNLLSLEDLPRDFVFNDLYGAGTEELSTLIHNHVSKADKIVFVIPEYNGSFPGILKCFIDGIHPRHFRDKKTGIVGVSDGRAGNLRGQEHLTGILHYLKAYVHYLKPKISHVDELVNDSNELSDERTMRILNDHASVMINW